MSPGQAAQTPLPEQDGRFCPVPAAIKLVSSFQALTHISKAACQSRKGCWGCRSGELDKQHYQLGQHEWEFPPDQDGTFADNISVVGAGVLAMPLAMSHMGILLGVFVIIWSGLTAGFGLYLQTRCARYLDRGSASFFALSQITYPNAAVVFDAAIAIKCFGVGVSYLIIIGDLMPGVIRGFTSDVGGLLFLLDRHFWVTGFM